MQARRILALIAVAFLVAGCPEQGSTPRPSGVPEPSFAPPTVGEHDGDLNVGGPLTFPGSIRGTMTVLAGGDLTLTGQVGEDLIVLEGGAAEVRGIVGGNVVNRGGEVIVYGSVGGRVIDEGKTKTKVEAGAVVGGRTVP
jgi:hypothetical protein